TDEEKRNRAIMMGVLGAGAAGGRRLFRDLSGAEGERLARQQLTGIGEGKTTKGFLRRVGEQYLNVGKSEALKTAQEQARGTVSNIESKVAGDLRTALPALQELTPPQRDALKIFMGSDRGAGAQALLATAGLPKEVSDFVTNITSNKAELQRIVGEAQSDPEKKKLIQDTLGNYVTEPYRAYVNPKEWQKRGVDPALVDQVVAENQKLPQYAGMTPEKIRADVEDWIKNDVTNFGGDFDRFANEGTSRMSKSLFTERKALRPSVRKILGHIEDPIEREVLTVAKLAKSANTAKLVGELTQPHAVDESGRRLTMTKADWQTAIDAAKAGGKADEAAFLQSNYEPVPNTLPGLGKLSQEPGGMMAQRQVMDALQIGPGHQTLSWETGLFPMLNRIAKASHTLYNPSTHIHNVVQAPLQAIAAGINPLTFVGQVRRFFADPKRLEWAKQDGVLDAHLGAGEFRRAADNFEKLMTPETWSNLPGRAISGVHEAVKGLYGKPDQWARGAAYNKFIDEGLNKGMGEAAARRYAVEMTNRYTQNYSNVASAVGLLRNVPLVNPFISYSAEMLRVIKNLASDVVTNANGRRWASAAALTTYLGLGSGIAALVNSARSTEDKEKLQSLIPLLPPYMRSRTQFMVGNPKGGNTNLFNANPWLPAEDFIQTAKNIANGDWDALADTNPVAGLERNPLLNVYTETSTGKDTATGQPTSFLQSMRQNMLPGWVPGNYTADKLVKGFTRNAEGELGVTDASGRRETPLSAVGSLFGVSVAQMNPRK